jgi:hypothetical protein
MSQCVIMFKSFQNASALSRSSFIADTIVGLNAVKHFPRMSLNVRRLSNVCFLHVRSVKVSDNFAAALMKVYLFEWSLHHCHQSSSTFKQDLVFPPGKSCSPSCVSSRYSRNGMLAGSL